MLLTMIFSYSLQSKQFKSFKQKKHTFDAFNQWSKCSGVFKQHLQLQFKQLSPLAKHSQYLDHSQWKYIQNYNFKHPVFWQLHGLLK